MKKTDLKLRKFPTLMKPWAVLGGFSTLIIHIETGIPLANAVVLGFLLATLSAVPELVRSWRD